VTPLPYVETWENDETVEAREAEALSEVDRILDTEGKSAAALIVEPLMQGASGMRVCRPQFLKAVVDRARAAGLLVIFDEVATGFGRTGTMFAFEQVGVVPDIICLSKGLTAGYMPMAVTVARERLFEAFLSDSFDQALPHGHTFTANPLACSVSLRSLELFEEEGTLGKVARISERHGEALETLMAHERVIRPRKLGTLLAFDLVGGGEGYKSDESLVLRDWYLANGLNIRPLGPCVYLLPPYCISEDELSRAYAGLIEGLDSLSN
jgi:adenosylmethionine-8-amino-7-oxononanoate aminotransferase